MALENDILNDIRAFEGFRDKAYWDHGQWSIGYGTKASGKDATITKEEAEEAALKHIRSDIAANRKYGDEKGYNYNDNQLRAIGSFTYNVGRDGLRQVTKDGTRTHDEVQQKMLEYNKASGQALPALTTRRNKESTLYGTKVGDATPVMGYGSSPTFMPSTQENTDMAIKNPYGINYQTGGSQTDYGVQPAQPYAYSGTTDLNAYSPMGTSYGTGLQTDNLFQNIDLNGSQEQGGLFSSAFNGIADAFQPASDFLGGGMDWLGENASGLGALAGLGGAGWNIYSGIQGMDMARDALNAQTDALAYNKMDNERNYAREATRLNHNASVQGAPVFNDSQFMSNYNKNGVFS